MRFEATMSELVSWMEWKSPAACGDLSGGPVFSQRSGRGRWLLAAWFLLLGVVLAGPLRAAQDESKVLREQATKFWEARLKADWAVVYDYLSEEERTGKTKEKYVELMKEAGPWRYLHYKMGAVETVDDMGWVKIEYAAEPVKFPGIKPKRVDHWEKWEKVDNRWLLLPAKRLVELPQLPPSQRPLNEEKAVKARAEEFWKAREKNDYAAIYHLCAPAFRKQVPIEQWLTMKAQYLYLGHEILWAEVKGNQAMVRTAYEYRINDPNVSKMDPKEEIAMHQWIKVDNQWFLNANAKGE